MKNKVKYFIIGIIILILVGVIIFVITNKDGSTPKKVTSFNGKSDKELVLIASNILSEDYEIKNMIYGDITLDDSTLKIGDNTYNHFYGKYITSINNLNKAIDKIYAASVAKNLKTDMGKYNKIIEEQNSLYIQKNKKCDIPEFHEKISVLDKNKDFISVSAGSYKVEIFLVNGEYKLNETPYRCFEDTTSDKTES